MNMSHMHLFHHFSTATSEAMILGPQIWKEKVVPSAFKVALISHAFLLAPSGMYGGSGYGEA